MAREAKRLVVRTDGWKRWFSSHLAATGIEVVRNGVDVDFVGPQDAQRIVPAYENADSFVLPSQQEAFPMARLEAMAAGLAGVYQRMREERA